MTNCSMINEIVKTRFSILNVSSDLIEYALKIGPLVIGNYRSFLRLPIVNIS